MGALVAGFVEVWREGAWSFDPLEINLEMDFVLEVTKNKSLRRRGIPNDASPELESALSHLGEEFGEESWATYDELSPRLAGFVIERRVLGPILWRAWKEHGTLRGSLYNEGTPALVAKFGARIVSNEEMDRYVASEAFARETTGLSDGQCKVFSVVEVKNTATDRLGVTDLLMRMERLGPPDSVRLVWTVGP